MTGEQQAHMTAEVDVARLIYSAIASLDGYVEDEQGKFDWAAPDDEVHAFVNDLERPIGTYLYGRRMYETMVFWETASTEADEPAVFWDCAGIWRAAECRARWRRNRRGAGRRVPSVLVPDRGGRRQARPAGQRPRATQTCRWALVPKRRRSPPVPRRV